MSIVEKKSPRVSVIIPVYNTEKYLKQCLDSVIAQSFADIEIICVDDGSTDNSFEILNGYAKTDTRFVIVQKENQGAGEARNKGIDLAKGKYLMFLDSDDYLEPSTIEKLVNIAEKNDNDIVVCSTNIISDNKENLNSENPYWPINLEKAPLETSFSPQNHQQDLFELYGIEPWNKLYSAELIKKHNLRFQNLSSCNDVGFGYIVRIYAKNIYITNEKLINYRLNRKNSISHHRVDKAANIILSALYVKEELEKAGLFEQLKNTYTKAFTSHFRYELSKMDLEQYNLFVAELKKLMPENWTAFEGALKKDKVTIDTINKAIGNKKVFLWGASLFLEELLKKETARNPNIIGIIDKNPSRTNEKLGAYKIYNPEVLKTTSADGVLLTVFSNNEYIYKSLKKELGENYPQIELLPNIFENKQSPKISVIIPVFNAEKYLKQCLESIQNQTFSDIEIICIDDCSSDNSLEILREYENNDSRIKVIHLEKNLRQGGARNTGLKAAKGEYIAFVDADDWIDKDLLQKQYNKITEENVDLVLAEMTNFYEEQDTNQNIKLIQRQNELYSQSTQLSEEKTEYDYTTSKDVIIGAPAKLYKKSIIDEHKISFPEKLIEEDIAFHFLYMMRVKSLYNIKEKLYHRRVHDNSTIYKLGTKKQNITDKIKVLKFICKYLKQNKLYSKYKHKFLGYVEAAIIGNNQTGRVLDILKLLMCSPLDILKVLLKQEFLLPLRIFWHLYKNKDKKIAFWGASLFLERFLSKYKIKNKNITGIIDKNEEKWNSTLCGYKINSPEKLLKEVDIVILSIKNNSQSIYEQVKNEIESNYPKTELVKNIFN